MEKLGHTIREARRKLGITQKEAADLAGLSRASYQNIEASRGNPSLASLERAVSVVGLTIVIRGNIDWDRLCDLGLPLAAERTRARTWIPSSALLVEALNEAVHWYLESPRAQHYPREREALEALALALHIGWPTTFEQCTRTIPGLDSMIPKSISGRHIKLYRIARSRLSRYI